MGTFIASVIVFGLLIVIHELGHFMVAKAVGIKVREFSLGFGPKLVSAGRGETAYNLRAFPLGGFVSMAGMDPSEENEADEDRGFNKKTVAQRMAVIFAGPLMNMLLAIVILAVIFMVYGVPDRPSTTVQATLPGKPAAAAGIQPGDRIVEINGQRVEDWNDLSKSVGANPDRQISVVVERNQKRLTLQVETYRNEEGAGMIGIQPAPQKTGPLNALVSGVRYTALISYQIMATIVRGIAGQASLELGGPVLIVATINEAVRSVSWFMNLMSLSAFLSISLGLFNLFPIPALDGSRLVFLFLEKLRGRPVEPERENFIHMIGFGLLLLLFVVITYNDILRLVVR